MTDAQLDDGSTPWRVTFTRRFTQPPGTVWSAITDDEHLASWFPTRIIGERSAGAALRFEFRNGEGPDFAGEMLAFEPPTRLEFRWGDELLRFTIADDGTGSVLTLEVAFDELGTVTRDTAGWHFCLDRLDGHIGDGPPIDETDTRWKQYEQHYRAKFPPAASTIGPPSAD